MKISWLVSCLAVILGLVISTFMFMSFWTVISIVITACLLLNTVNESSRLHDAAETQNRLWTLFIGLLFFAQAMIWCKKLLFDYYFVFIFLGLFLMLSTSSIIRSIHRTYLNISPWSIDNSVSDSDITEVYESIMKGIDELDSIFFPSTFLQIFAIRKVLLQEKAIINALSGLEDNQMNRILRKLPLGRMLYKVKDHRNFRIANRTKLLTLLAKERLGSLTVLSKLAVLDGIQRLGLQAVDCCEECVAGILLSVMAEQLSEMKSLFDAKGDYLNLRKLLFDDIRSESIRSQILTHFKTQADVVRMYRNSHLDSMLKRLVPFGSRKVISDFDDTVMCSGGKYPAGMDKRYGAKCLYPGVLAFLKELDVRSHDVENSGSNASGNLCNLVFLSARPHVFGDLSERTMYTKIDKLRRQQGLHSAATLLPGNLESGSEFIFGNTMALSKKKFDNFSEFSQLYPEYSFVFVGDNGQGDVQAADMMFDRYKDCIDGLFIHLVQDLKKTPNFSHDAKNRWTQHSNIIFFDNYIDAAICAFHRGMITVDGLSRIANKTRIDFIEVASWEHKNVRLNEQRKLNSSIEIVNNVLKLFLMVPIPLIEFAPFCSLGSLVRCKHGEGIATSFRRKDGVISIALDLSLIRVKLFAVEENVTVVADCRLGLTSDKKIVKKSISSPILTPKRADAAIPVTNSRVWTPYGYGNIETDKIPTLHGSIRVKLAFGGFACLNKKFVVPAQRQVPIVHVILAPEPLNLTSVIETKQPGKRFLTFWNRK